MLFRDAFHTSKTYGLTSADLDGRVEVWSRLLANYDNHFELVEEAFAAWKYKSRDFPQYYDIVREIDDIHADESTLSAMEFAHRRGYKSSGI